MSANLVLIDHQRSLDIESVCLIARGKARLALSDEPAFQQRIQRGADAVQDALQGDPRIYGLTTGFGDSCDQVVAAASSAELSRSIYTYHGCGTGALLDAACTRATLLARLNSLARGFSGVRPVLLQRLSQLIAHDILPLIPSEGSVGASGDLTPLSYVAAVLCGERSVHYRGEQRPAGDVLKALQIEPLQLAAKEGLALMNGTAVMTGIACLAWQRANYLSQLATRISACMIGVMGARLDHYSETLFQAKPQPGPVRVAARIRRDFGQHNGRAVRSRLQDPYSLRCSPHVIGTLEDSLPWLRGLIESELNSANDNPLLDPQTGEFLHGGHFYGGHIALAMDTLKATVANLADLADRQMAVLVDPRYNKGLPANLAPPGATNHGLKALQIACSAWTAEALKLTMPASVFSRSTECHNQDKVSMGTIAARDAMRVLQLSEQVMAACLIGVRQAMYLQKLDSLMLPGAREMLDQLQQRIEPLATDRALDADLQALMGDIAEQYWVLYADETGSER